MLQKKSPNIIKKINFFNHDKKNKYINLNNHTNPLTKNLTNI